MIERIDLNARWGDRGESLDEVASRAAKCLKRLATFGDVFTHWFQLGKSRKEALEQRFEPTFESCRALLAKGRNRRDTDKSIIETLGFRMWLWNGQEGESAGGVRFNCGAYPAVAAMPTPNECMVELPFGGSVADRLLQEEMLLSITETVVESWDPDWVRVSTFQMRQAVYPQPYQGVEVGWLTYLSDRYGSLPALPAEYQTARIDGLGTVVIAKQIDRLTASNPVHVESVQRLSNLLRVAGLLSPTPPRAVV